MPFFRPGLSRLAAPVSFMLVLLPIVAQSASRATTPNQPAALQSALNTIAEGARPGTLGVAVLDLRSGRRWSVNADQAYPMMSMFKAPVAAAVLSRIDAGSLRMEQTVTLTRADVDPGSAVPSIGENFREDRMTFTLRQLMAAAVSQSDNTAVDALIKVVGGPGAVTTFLRAHGIADMRVDEDERGAARVFHYLEGDAEPPASETPEQQKQRLRAGYKAFMADPRNRCTPDAAAIFLRKLWQNELLSGASTQYLLGLLYAQTVPHRLRDGLPPGVRLADKTGTGPTVEGRIAAFNDVGVLTWSDGTWPEGHTVIVAAFLMDSNASEKSRNVIFADLARQTVKSLQASPDQSGPVSH